MAQQRPRQRKDGDEEFHHMHIAPSAEEERDLAVEEGLRAIYGESSEDLKIVQKGRGGWIRALFFFVSLLGAVFFGGLIWFGIAFFLQEQTSPLDTLSLDIDVPQDIRNGEEMTFLVLYGNGGRKPLNLSLDVNLPPGFVAKSFSPLPEDAERLVWNLGTLGQQSDGRLVISGTFYEDYNEDVRLQVMSTFGVPGESATFSRIAQKDLHLGESVFSDDLQGPDQVRVGESVEYSYSITNTGSQAKDLEVAFHLPDAFAPSTWSESLPPGEGTVWKISSLAPGATAVQKVTGIYKLASEGYVFEVEPQVRVDDAVFTQATTTRLTKVLETRAQMSLVGNGSPDAVSLAPGDVLRIVAQITNTSTEKLSGDFVLDFQPESGIPLAWSEGSFGDGVLTQKGIVFSAKTIGELAPSEKKTLSVSIPVKSTITPQQVSVFSATLQGTFGEDVLYSAPLTVMVRGDMALTQSVRYFDDTGIVLGDGVFPPRVGEDTEFLANLTLTRSLHALDAAEVHMTLPLRVRSGTLRSPSFGTLSWDEEHRWVVWKLGYIPEDLSSVTASIPLIYTPDLQDEGTYGSLITSTTITAKDAVTGEERSLVLGEVTTELPDDSHAQGKGTVASKE